MFKLIAFIVLSAVVVYISRSSLRAPRSHGFYRFFAWEFILALIVINSDGWFVEPGAWHQIISWVLLMSCIVPLVLGVRTLVSRGKPVSQRQGQPQLLAFEKTSALVTTGIYHYIRHPLYSSLLLLAWGAFFKAPSLPGIFLALLASLSLVATARADEAECLRFFGPVYLDYLKMTRRFIPFIF